MNDKRRKELNQIFKDLHLLQGRLDDIRNQEQDAYDNLPETIQSGEKGEQMQEYLNSLERAFDGLESVIGDLADMDFIEEVGMF